MSALELQHFDWLKAEGGVWGGLDRAADRSVDSARKSSARLMGDLVVRAECPLTS